MNMNPAKTNAQDPQGHNLEAAAVNAAAAAAVSAPTSTSSGSASMIANNHVAGIPMNAPPQEPQNGSVTPLSSLSGMSYPMGISTLPMNSMIDDKIAGASPGVNNDNKDGNGTPGHGNMGAASGGAPDDGSGREEGSSNGRKVSTTRRAAQNRSAQKAFRQRRERYIKDIEQQAAEVPALKQTIEELRAENLRLRDYTIALQGRLIELGSDNYSGQKPGESDAVYNKIMETRQ